MAATRTPGITLDARGDVIIDKEYRGIRLFRRLGKISLQDAERILQSEMARVAAEFDLRLMHARPLFRHCAARYLAESKQKRTAETIAWHVQMLQRYLGDLAPDRIHDGTLNPFVDQRLSEGAGPTTINRSLEVVRTILNRAARAYRDDDGRPWLERVPPLITMRPENPRAPCPISWTEQDCIFQRLPGHLQRMVLFAVNTGLRDSNVCALQWPWEVFVPEVGRSARFASHVWSKPESGRRTRRGSGGTARSQHALDDGSLRERRHRAIDRDGESSVGAGGDLDDSAGG